MEEARLYLPYILLLPDLKNNLITKQFNEELELVPEFMFISNISQILSNFDFSQECYLDKLINRLAIKYPNALYFPFKLSQENFMKSNDSDDRKQVKVIDDLLSTNNISNEFTCAIQCLVLPEKILNAHFTFFKQKLLDEGDHLSDEYFKKAAKELYEQVFVKNAKYKGSEFAKIKSVQHQFQRLQDVSWNKDKTNARKILHSLQDSIDSLTKKRPRGAQYIDLGRLCRWFESFKWSGDKEFIEIPGQYNGDSKPFIENHVKIVRFEQRAKIFNSKQLPIELKMLGSDGKTYSFIVKYGEDLRQDQRIQQVLRLMSNKLSLDKNCFKNKLKIETYEVIPVNSFCGMLQMINNAQTISDFVEEASKNLLTQTFENLNATIKMNFWDFLLYNENFVSWQKTYENIVLKRDRAALIDKFRECEQFIPADLLTRALKSISKSLESYYVLRKNFSTSLAAMNVSHWLLSIGDRHISNIMLDMQKLFLVGIDFGVAFGAAATLQVPELVPFRLTSHFVDVMQPLGINGSIKKNMMHALRCFQDHKDTILICLEVFVKEPTLDWLMQSKIKSNGHVGASNWNPEKRIEIVKQKLSGANPVKLLIEELSNGEIKNNHQLFEAYKSIITGPPESIRSRVSSENLTVDEQISSLIDLATDPAILATTYIGWNSWF